MTQRNKGRKCATDSCTAQAYCKGLCVKHYTSARYKNNRERLLAKQKEYYGQNRETILAKDKEERLERGEEIRAKDREAYANNPAKRQQRIAYSTEWRKKNPERRRHAVREYYAKAPEKHWEWRERYAQTEKGRATIRRAQERRRRAINAATPKWLSREDWLEIQSMYTTCPETHHVDHIVPVQSKTVCGLHAPWNLQHLPRRVNIRKGNRL